MAIYSAANVDFKGRYELTRPKDVWRTDPRISPDVQVDDSFYTGNAFDRGHLTRREDQEFGSSPEDAIASAADTCHWSNCTRQHARFNESAQLWQGLERHILEEAVDADHFRAQVITGPVFGAKDPILKGFEATPYPLRYWKVGSDQPRRQALCNCVPARPTRHHRPIRTAWCARDPVHALQDLPDNDRERRAWTSRDSKPRCATR